MVLPELDTTLIKFIRNSSFVHGFLVCLAAFSVMVVRSEEADNGIRVFDSNGNAVGVSKKAGSKVSVQPKHVFIVKLSRYVSRFYIVYIYL